MPIPILMPALSPTMEDGKLAKWMVKEGDTVAPGDVLAEIETDKATMEVESVDDGVVGKILIDEGTEHVAVNKPIAVLLEEGEDESALKDFDGGAPPAAAPVTPAAPTQAETPEPSPEPAPQPAAKTSGSNGQAGRVIASPLARRLARDGNLDLSGVKGSGPNGRIVKLDVEAALKGGQAAALIVTQQFLGAKAF